MEKISSKKRKEYRDRYFKRNPWMRAYFGLRQRCNDKNHNRYPQYGGRGIKSLITYEELKELWFRDKAYLMKQPSIDRKDKHQSYTKANCFFSEKNYNSSWDKKKPILQINFLGKVVKEFESAKLAAEVFNVDAKQISNCACGRQPTCRGYKWQYKNTWAREKEKRVG